MHIVRYLDSAGCPRYAAQHRDQSPTRIEGDLFGTFRDTGEPVAVGKLLAPVAPPAVLCVGLNYRQHATESGAQAPQYPVLFMKMPSAIQHPGEPILLPRHLPSTQVDYECELAVIIGKPCKNVARDVALDYVLGYTCANDVSARDWQIKWGGSQWCRGKTFDTFCPLGPCIVTTDETSRCEQPADSDDSQRSSHAGLEHERHDFRCADAHRVSQWQHVARAGDGDPDGYSTRRRFCPQAACVPASGRYDHDRDRENWCVDESRTTGGLRRQAG